MELVARVLGQISAGLITCENYTASKGSSEVKDTTDVRVFCSRYKTRSLLDQILLSSFIKLSPYYYGLESSSLYTCNTS